jgi:hypothetical protein
MELLDGIYVLSGIFFGIAIAAIVCAITIVYIFRDK